MHDSCLVRGGIVNELRMYEWNCDVDSRMSDTTNSTVKIGGTYDYNGQASVIVNPGEHDVGSLQVTLVVEAQTDVALGLGGEPEGDVFLRVGVPLQDDVAVLVELLQSREHTMMVVHHRFVNHRSSFSVRVTEAAFMIL